MLTEHLKVGFVARRISTIWTRFEFGLSGPIIPTWIFSVRPRLEFRLAVFKIAYLQSDAAPK